MAYEALIVIGFGVSLAVVSVVLFVAHVKRINAPNRADPTGIVVNIDLGAALAKDEAARNRKAACRRRIGKDLGDKLVGGDMSGAFALQQNGLDRRRKRPCATTGGGREEGREDKVTVNDATEDTQVWKPVVRVKVYRSIVLGYIEVSYSDIACRRWCHSSSCRKHGAFPFLSTSESVGGRHSATWLWKSPCSGSSGCDGSPLYLVVACCS